MTNSKDNISIIILIFCCSIITVLGTEDIDKPEPSSARLKTLADIARIGKYYRHPDSALISYPLVVQEPLGSINKHLNIAIVGAGAAGIAAFYELSNLPNSSEYIKVTIYESDPENFIHYIGKNPSLNLKGPKAGRVYSAQSSDPTGGTDHTMYEVGAMRFPEIAGLMWHYAKIVYGDEKVVDKFPNPGTVPTELLHGDRVDRFGSGEWLDPNSPTKQVVDIVRSRLYGSKYGFDTSLFPIAGQDPAKLSIQLASKDTTDEQLANISKEWKEFVKEYDERTLESAVREIIRKSINRLPDIEGLPNVAAKINYYVELCGTVGFGTGGFKPVYNMALIEMMRLLLWDYSNEYFLPTDANVYFIRDLYLKAIEKNSNVTVKLARVNDVGHLDGNTNGDTLVVSYAISPDDGSENLKPEVGIYNYVILATTPKQTSSMISKLGYDNSGRQEILGDYKRPVEFQDYSGVARSALILSTKFPAANAQIYTALKNLHMISSSKIFSKVKKSEFDKYAPEFLNQGKIKAIVSDCGLGSSYLVSISDGTYYSFLMSYAWEDVTSNLQCIFCQYPRNIDNLRWLINSVINCTIRNVKDPDNNYALGPWWFGEALRNIELMDPMSFDWTTSSSSGAFKLDNTGGHSNSNLLFRYHTHALTPELKNKFFLANDSYSHLGGWLEGAFMSAVNAVSGLIVAANEGDVNALSVEARKVLQSFDNIVENRVQNSPEPPQKRIRTTY